MSEPGNGVEYRFRKLEDSITQLTRRLDNLDEHGSRRVGVIETELGHVRSDLADLAGEIRELRGEIRDVRHRMNGIEGSVANLTRIVADQDRKVEGNSEKVEGLVRSVIVAALSLGVLVIGSIVSMWLAFGGPP